jgi:hypothetical protein
MSLGIAGAERSKIIAADLRPDAAVRLVDRSPRQDQAYRNIRRIRAPEKSNRGGEWRPAWLRTTACPSRSMVAKAKNPANWAGPIRKYRLTNCNLGS